MRPQELPRDPSIRQDTSYPWKADYGEHTIANLDITYVEKAEVGVCVWWGRSKRGNRRKVERG